MSSSMGIRNKLKNRLKLVVNRKKIDVSDDIEPIRYRRNQANSSNVKYKDGKVSCKIDGVYHRNPPVSKEKQFHSDHDREHMSSYKKDVRERGRPLRNVELFDRKSLSEEGKYSRRGSGDFMKDKKNERTPRRKDPLHGSEHSTMVKEKSNRFRAVGYQTKLKTKHVDRKFSGTRNDDEGENSDRKYKRKLYGTRHKDEGENGFRENNSDRGIKSYRRTDKRDDNQLVSDAKTRHNDESLANHRVKMPRQKKGSNEDSVITDEKYNMLGAVAVNSRSKKKDLNGSASSTRYMDGGQGIFTKKNSNIKFNSNKKTHQRDVSNQLVTRMSDAKNTHQARSLVNTSKKSLKGKKGSESDGESTITSDLPKKRKRVMRIDPHDISNKRIDDSISTHVETKTVENVEVSQNAQFRAIKPSSEILSFVEDNLLGRRRLIELRRAGYDINISSPLDNIPFPTSSERERMEENVFRNKLTFFAAAKVSSSLPPLDLPEIAFAGRSNVGKSSLLNSLTRQWGVVRTSDKPGLTQSINFFNLAQKLCLVDLPGYGFAYAKEEVKDAWEELVKEYVSTRAGLKRVCLLIDTKWGMKPRDYELINLMEGSETPYQIVLTKTDLVFPMDVARRAMQIQETLKKNKSVVKPVMMVSSKTGAGIRSLRSVVAKIARFVKL